MAKNDLIEIKKMGGIKCDNPSCDYHDNSVRVEDYKKWLNRPCPKCGCNLLTKKDYKSFMTVLSLISLTNKMGKIFTKDTQEETSKITMSAKWNGSGEVTFNKENN